MSDILCAMFRTLVLSLLITLPIQAGWLSRQSPHPRYQELKEGDIVFQDTGGAQGAAVRAATNSPYTHCGVLFKKDGTLYVLEAVQPVKVTSFLAWKQRSKVFHARRLKDGSQLTPAAFQKALKWGTAQLGKNYDFHFKWGDDELYCSELVWKIYHQAAGITLCTPKSFQSYFLKDPAVTRIVRQRYGAVANLPKNMPVVAPSDLAASPLLAEVPRRQKKL